jgi:hypothetical protein
MLIRIFGKDAVMWHSERLERSGAVGQSGAEALVQRHRPRHQQLPRPFYTVILKVLLSYLTPFFTSTSSPRMQRLAPDR